MSSTYPSTSDTKEWRRQPSEDDRRDAEPEKPSYTLRKLRDFMATKKYFVQRQFVVDDNVVFIKVHTESIGENILIYFPSKYNIPAETGGVPITEIIPHELTDKDLLSIQKQSDSDVKENYGELTIDDLKDPDSYSDDNYKAISLDSNRDNDIRKKMVKYTAQLEKFRNCTTKIPYKFAILTDDVLCIINRYNETENYLVKNGKGLVPNIIDSKTDTLCPIEHELYVLIDLPSFYEKIGQVPDDLLRLYRNFYAVLNRAHTKQTAVVEHRFKNYQAINAKMIGDYSTKSKFLDLMSTLTNSLDKSIKQERELIEKIGLIEGSRDSSTMSKDADRSFKLSKNDNELQKIRELKKKTIEMLHEIKIKYHNFLLIYDSVITETSRDLKNIETNIGSLGISTGSGKKK